MNELTLFDEEKTAMVELMTVKDVVELLGYDEEYLRKKCAELGFTQNGKKTMLNEQQVDTLKSALVPRTSDMKVRGQNAVTHIEMLRNIQRDMEWLVSYNTELQRQVKEQSLQLTEQKPKVQWYDDVADSENLTEISTIDKLTKIGAKKIFALLVADRVIYKKFDDGVEYYASYSGYDKYFKSIPVPFLKGDKKATRYKLMFTQSGAIWASKRYGSNV